MFALSKRHLAALIVGLAFVSGDLQAFSSSEEKEISIIPEPLSLKREAGTFVIERGTAIILGSNNVELRRVGEQLASKLRTATGYPLEIEMSAGTSRRANAILLALDDRSHDLGATR
jgi:hypothetical protein